jgi:hypothetical protein
MTKNQMFQYWERKMKKMNVKKVGTSISMKDENKNNE